MNRIKTIVIGAMLCTVMWSITIGIIQLNLILS